MSYTNVRCIYHQQTSNYIKCCVRRSSISRWGIKPKGKLKTLGWLWTDPLNWAFAHPGLSHNASARRDQFRTVSAFLRFLSSYCHQIQCLVAFYKVFWSPMGLRNKYQINLLLSVGSRPQLTVGRLGLLVEVGTQVNSLTSMGGRLRLPAWFGALLTTGVSKGRLRFHSRSWARSWQISESSFFRSHRKSPLPTFWFRCSSGGQPRLLPQVWIWGGWNRNLYSYQQILQCRCSTTDAPMHIRYPTVL